MIEERQSIYTRRFKRYEQAGKAALVLLGVVGTIWAGMRHFWTDIRGLATDDELSEHDASPLAHPPIVSTQADLVARLREMDQRIKTVDADSKLIGEVIVSLEAADHEPRNSLKAAAATFYRREYKKLIQRGYTVKEAMEEIRDMPWPQRPR